MIEVQLAAMIQ